MKIICTLVLVVLTLSTAIAQDRLQHDTIHQTELAGSVTSRSATEQITALNSIERSARVQYSAGKAVTLQPGFTAQAGSVFTASIGLVSAGEKSLRPEVEFSARAYPNPFQHATTIEYILPQAGGVAFTLVDEQGRIVRQDITASPVEAGHQEVQLSGTGLLPGVYFYQMRWNNAQRTLRLLKIQ